MLATQLVAAAHPTVPTHLTWVQALVIGFVQGITELFPVSSLGHSVLIPKLFGWNDLVKSQDASESFWLAFIVALHVANALGLLLFFWRDWIRIIKAFFSTLAKRRIETSSERLAWLIIVATIPVGLVGLVLEHPIRDLLAKPMSAAIFLAVNGVILIGGQRLRAASGSGARHAKGRVHAATAPSGAAAVATDPDATLGRTPFREALVIGLVQCTALIAGISRDGVTMVAGLVRGLDNDDAAKFAFLLATPVILAAGVLKISDLTDPVYSSIRPQILGGAVVTLIASLIAVRFLSRWFKDRTLTPFGIYCVGFGLFMVLFVALGA